MPDVSRYCTIWVSTYAAACHGSFLEMLCLTSGNRNTLCSFLLAFPTPWAAFDKPSGPDFTLRQLFKQAKFTWQQDLDFRSRRVTIQNLSSGKSRAHDVTKSNQEFLPTLL